MLWTRTSGGRVVGQTNPLSLVAPHRQVTSGQEGLLLKYPKRQLSLELFVRLNPSQGRMKFMLKLITSLNITSMAE